MHGYISLSRMQKKAWKLRDMVLTGVREIAQKMHESTKERQHRYVERGVSNVHMAFVRTHFPIWHYPPEVTD